MKKIGLGIIGILIVIYIGYGVVLTSFSVNVTIREQCWNENQECYKYCGTEDNKKTCLLFKQGYWKGIFLWGYSFVGAKIKDISNKEEFGEYGLLQRPNGTITLEDFEKGGNIIKESEVDNWTGGKICSETPDTACVPVILKENEILVTPYEYNEFISEETDLTLLEPYYTDLKTFRKVTGLKEASPEYVQGELPGTYLFDAYTKFYKTKEEREVTLNDKLENSNNIVNVNNSLLIIHDVESGTITLDNGEESITIMDKNLGANLPGTGEKSYGYYFQRGNNHGFQLNSEIKTGTELVSREESMQYGPNNWYDSDVQFVVLEELNRNVDYYNYNYLASFNDNLWGGSGDSEIINRMGEYVIDQFRGDTANPRAERQGPCPEGFHVPSFGEIHKLFKLWIDIKYPDDIEKKEHVRWMSIGGGGNQIGREFSNDLLLPMAGGIRFDGKATPHDQESEGFYWMSSPGRFLNFHSYMIVEYAESYRAATFPVRCFKD